MLRHLVLPLALLTFVNAIDRVNVSFAAHAMGADIGLTPTTFGLGVSAFFLAYLLFQYPHASLLQRFGIRRWLLVSVTLWGLAGLMLARVESVGEFLAARFLLGIAEAGFAPGCTWYINRWVPAASRAKAMATVLAAVPLSLVLGGPLCGWMLGLDAPGGMAPWRWMFLLQAIPNFVLAIAAYLYFRNSVSDSSWLSDEERALLEPAAAPPPNESMLSVLRDPRVWRCAITWLLVMTGAYALIFWLPQMVRQMNIGSSEFQIGAFSAIPQVGLVVGMLANGWHSDRKGERRWHVGFASDACRLCDDRRRIAATGLGSAGLAYGCWRGHRCRAIGFLGDPASMGVGNGRVSVAAVSVITMFGTAGGIIGPTLIGWIKDTDGKLCALALVLLSLFLILGGLVIAPLRKNGEPI